MYKKTDPKIVKRLIDIAGSENVFSLPGDLEAYAKDETPGAYYLPEAVVRPNDPGQVKEILKMANFSNIPLVPRGGGTGLSGGALAVNGGIVLTFENLNKIKDIDNKNRMAIVEPGVINGIFQEEAAKIGLFYPVNPASMDSCTMGGNVAESTGGANTVRFGTTRNYITGIKAVTGSCEEWTAGGKIVKNSTDQTLIQLMCGSEGILSIFTELYFRLISLPSYTSWIIAPFKDIYKIPEAALKIVNENIDPTMIELMDSSTLELCSSHLGKDIQHKEYHQLMVRFDSNDPRLIEDACVKTGELCASEGAIDVLVADSKREQEKLWEIRSAIHEAIVNQNQSVCEEDVVVPVACITSLIDNIYRIADDKGFKAVIFGHLGDGNIHLNFLNQNNRKDNIEEDIEILREEVFKTAVDLGGKLSGEHGIGISKKKYFKKYIHPNYINLLKAVKKQFDPNNILNPGKIID
ncbi:FAD-binding oxidoreductase [Elusimicrobiota bacterium]